MSEIDDLSRRIETLEERLRVYDTRHAIYDVLYRYARSVDRCDLDLLKSCYWPDGTDVHWFYNGNAHAFAEYVVPLLAEITSSQHSITNPIIELYGERAHVECQWHVVHHIPLNEGDTEQFIDQQLEGRYIDVFENRQGHWRILHRQVVLEAGREFISTPPMPLPDGHRGLGQRAPHDIVSKGLAILDVPVDPVEGADLWGDARARHRHVRTPRP